MSLFIVLFKLFGQVCRSLSPFFALMTPASIAALWRPQPVGGELAEWSRLCSAAWVWYCGKECFWSSLEVECFFTPRPLPDPGGLLRAWESWCILPKGVWVQGEGHTFLCVCARLYICVSVNKCPHRLGFGQRVYCTGEWLKSLFTFRDAMDEDDDAERLERTEMFILCGIGY